MSGEANCPTCKRELALMCHHCDVEYTPTEGDRTHVHPNSALVDLERLEKLMSAATPMPWCHGPQADENTSWLWEGTRHHSGDPEAPDTRFGSVQTSDAVLICEMRKALPALIAEVRAARQSSALQGSMLKEARNDVAHLRNLRPNVNATDACSGDWDRCWCEDCEKRRLLKGSGRMYTPREVYGCSLDEIKDWLASPPRGAETEAEAIEQFAMATGMSPSAVASHLQSIKADTLPKDTGSRLVSAMKVMAYGTCQESGCEKKATYTRGRYCVEHRRCLRCDQPSNGDLVTKVQREKACKPWGSCASLQSDIELEQRQARSWSDEVGAIAHALGIEHAPDTGPTYPGPLEAMLVQVRHLQEHSRLWVESEQRKSETRWTVSAYLVRDDRVLLVRHNKLQTWLPVGGGIELGERPIDAVVREVSEETGLGISDYAYLGYDEHDGGDRLDLNHAFRCIPSGGEPVSDGSWSEHMWLPIGDAPPEGTPVNVCAALRQLAEKVASEGDPVKTVLGPRLIAHFSSVATATDGRPPSEAKPDDRLEGLTAKELLDTLGDLGLSTGAMAYVGMSLEAPRTKEASPHVLSTDEAIVREIIRAYHAWIDDAENGYVMVERADDGGVTLEEADGTSLDVLAERFSRSSRTQDTFGSLMVRRAEDHRTNEASTPRTYAVTLETEESLGGPFQTLTIKRNGKNLDFHCDAGEPEDQTFYRDWDWVKPALEQAYAFGIEDGRCTDTPALTNVDEPYASMTRDQLAEEICRYAESYNALDRKLDAYKRLAELQEGALRRHAPLVDTDALRDVADKQTERTTQTGSNS